MTSKNKYIPDYPSSITNKTFYIRLSQDQNDKADTSLNLLHIETKIGDRDAYLKLLPTTRFSEIAVASDVCSTCVMPENLAFKRNEWTKVIEKNKELSYLNAFYNLMAAKEM